MIKPQLEITNREDYAVALFEQGYNCSQAVFMAYADVFDVDSEMAAKFATSFGGGMGRLREVCGAVSGMFLVLGFLYPHTNPTDKVSKNLNYKAVQRVAAEFKSEMGSYICAYLLKRKREPESFIASERTAEYYAARPCARCVAVAAHIIGTEIANNM